MEVIPALPGVTDLIRPWLRFVICATIGFAMGVGTAYWRIHTGAMGAKVSIGSWVTSKDVGTAHASAYIRSVIALRGLLALSAHEARYYETSADSAGHPLDGRCRYRVAGRRVPARWWSLTLYDHDGFLVGNQAKIYSIGSSHIIDPDSWSLIVAPTPQPGLWLPTGGIDRFALTLRTYLPKDGGVGNLTRGQLPSIIKEGC